MAVRKGLSLESLSCAWYSSNSSKARCASAIWPNKRTHKWSKQKHTHTGTVSQSKHTCSQIIRASCDRYSVPEQPLPLLSNSARVQDWSWLFQPKCKRAVTALTVFSWWHGAGQRKPRKRSRRLLLALPSFLPSAARLLNR